MSRESTRPALILDDEGFRDLWSEARGRARFQTFKALAPRLPPVVTDAEEFCLIIERYYNLLLKNITSAIKTLADPLIGLDVAGVVLAAIALVPTTGLSVFGLISSIISLSKSIAERVEAAVGLKELEDELEFLCLYLQSALERKKLLLTDLTDVKMGAFFERLKGITKNIESSLKMIFKEYLNPEGLKQAMARLATALSQKLDSELALATTILDIMQTLYDVYLECFTANEVAAHARCINNIANEVEYKPPPCKTPRDKLREGVTAWCRMVRESHTYLCRIPDGYEVEFTTVRAKFDEACNSLISLF